MLLIGDSVLENIGWATPGMVLRDRLARAYSAHKKAEDNGIELTAEYLEWLNYIYAKSRFGLASPWNLPQDKLISYIRWFVACSDDLTAPRLSSIV